MITPTRGRKLKYTFPFSFLDSMFTDDNPDKGTETKLRIPPIACTLQILFTDDNPDKGTET